MFVPSDRSQPCLPIPPIETLPIASPPSVSPRSNGHRSSSLIAIESLCVSHVASPLIVMVLIGSWPLVPLRIRRFRSSRPPPPLGPTLAFTSVGFHVFCMYLPVPHVVSPLNLHRRSSSPDHDPTVCAAYYHRTLSLIRSHRFIAFCYHYSKSHHFSATLHLFIVSPLFRHRSSASAAFLHHHCLWF